MSHFPIPHGQILTALLECLQSSEQDSVLRLAEDVGLMLWIKDLNIPRPQPPLHSVVPPTTIDFHGQGEFLKGGIADLMVLCGTSHQDYRALSHNLQGTRLWLRGQRLRNGGLDQLLGEVLDLKRPIRWVSGSHAR